MPPSPARSTARAGLTLRELASHRVTELKAVGDKLRAGLAEMGIETVLDLLEHYPRRYYTKLRHDHPELLLEICNDGGRMVDFGNVRMVGFEIDDLRDMYKLRIDANQRVTMLPAEVIAETIKAFSVSATSPTGYGALGAPSGQYFAPANGPDCIETAGDFGDCGVRTLVMRGEMFKNMDISIAKLIPLKGRVRAELRFEVLNVFNAVNFSPVTGLGTNATGYEVTGGGAVRFIQLGSRISW